VLGAVGLTVYHFRAPLEVQLAPAIQNIESNITAILPQPAPCSEPIPYTLGTFDTQFSILIPKIGANAKVIPNVDPSNPEDYLPKLQLGVAHAAGSVFPGMNGNIYLFAHSTDNFWNVAQYNAVFFLLKDLKPGDEIVIFFENVRHNYVVTGSKTVDPSDVSYLVNSQKSNKETLILQTCWPPGTTWQRLLVFAKPVAQ